MEKITRRQAELILMKAKNSYPVSKNNLLSAAAVFKKENKKISKQNAEFLEQKAEDMH